MTAPFAVCLALIVKAVNEPTASTRRLKVFFLNKPVQDETCDALFWEQAVSFIRVLLPVTLTLSEQVIYLTSGETSGD